MGYVADRIPEPRGRGGVGRPVEGTLRRMRRMLRTPLAALLALAAAGCGGDASNARKLIREEHAPRVKEVLREDMERHPAGVADAAQRLAPGYAVEDPAERERQMRVALRHIQEPPRGVPEFITSPMSFLAVVDEEGEVIARDVADEDDRMQGEDFGERYEVVRRALEEGRPGYALGEFPSEEEGAKSSWSMLFVHPVKREGEVVGAVVAGIPLWRMAQRLGRQLQAEHAGEEGTILWVYIYKGDELHHFGTPPDLDTVVPDARTRQRGFEASPGGFTGEVQQFGRWYGWGVVPARCIADDVGIIIFRSDPV